MFLYLIALFLETWGAGIVMTRFLNILTVVKESLKLYPYLLIFAGISYVLSKNVLQTKQFGDVILI